MTDPSNKEICMPASTQLATFTTKEIRQIVAAVREDLSKQDLKSAKERLTKIDASKLPATGLEALGATFLKVGVALEKDYDFQSAYSVYKQGYCFSKEQIIPRLIPMSILQGHSADDKNIVDEAIANQPTPGLFNSKAQILLEQGELAAAQTALSTAASYQDQRLSKYLSRDLNHINILNQAKTFIDSQPQPVNPSGVVIIFNDGPFISMWSTLVARRLREKGYATVCLSSRFAIPFEMPQEPQIAALHGAMKAQWTRFDLDGFGEQSLSHKWDIDWEAKRVSVGELNFYQGIFERMSTVLKRFSIKLDGTQNTHMFNFYLLQCDRLLSACQLIKNQIAARGLSVRFLISGIHFAPAFVVQEFCKSHNNSFDMECLSFYSAYEHYYNNLSSHISTAVVVNNSTRTPDQRSGMFARADQFDRWLSRQKATAEIMDRAKRVLNHNRTGTDEPNAEAQEIIQKLQAHRARNGRVVCLFGKIVYDMAVPYDGGPAHVDLADWLNHSIESVRGTNTILLVKPHPHEVRNEMHRPDEFFFDLISVSIPENVILLDHRLFNLKELTPYLDAGLVWHGTSTVELGMLDVPVIAASYWGAKDHPVSVAHPADRQDYVKLLNNYTRSSVPEGNADRCALLSEYCATEEVMIPYPYAVLPVLAPPEGHSVLLPSWNTELVERYLENGDPHVDRIANLALRDGANAN
jgi:capsular polysaccharide export protein